MIYLTESFAWCMVQVTLLTTVAAGLYLVARRVRTGGRTAMLVTCLATVGILTLLCVSPWPRWRFMATGSTLDEDEVRVLRVNASELSTGDLETAPRADVFAAVPSASPDVSSSPDPVVAPVGAAQRIERATVAENSHTSSQASVPWWHYVVWAAWAATAIGLIRLLIGTVYLRRCRREGAPVADDALRSLFDELREQYGIARAVDLRESPRLGVAATVGWRRPVVLVRAAWRDWSADQRRAVLAHELAHVRQRHFPAWLVSQISVVAHFYHPLVHWLARRLRLEQEIAADALAADAFADRRQYAAVLAGLALGPTRPPGLITPLGLFMSRPLLMRRIAMLRQSNEPARSPSAWRRYSLLTVLVLAAVAVAGLRASAQEEPQLPPPTDAAQTTRVVAMLQVSRQEPSIAGLQKPPMTDAAWKEFCSTQLALLKSDWLLRAALRPPEVATLPLVKSQRNPITWLQNNLRVGFVGDSEVLYILMYCTQKDADATRQLVDAVVKAYTDEVLFKEESRKLAVIEAIQTRLLRINRELTRKHNLFIDTAEAEGNIAAVDSTAEVDLIMREIADLQRKKSGLEGEMYELMTNHSMMIAQLEDPQMAAAQVDQALASDPNVLYLQQQVMMLQAKLSQAQAVVKGGRSKAMADLERQIAQLNSQIGQYRSQMEQQLAQQQRTTPDPRKALYTKLYQIQSGFQRQQLVSLNNALTEKVGDLDKMLKKSVALQSLAVEIEQLQQVANDMAVKLEALQVDQSAPPKIAQPLHPAISSDVGPPPTPDRGR